MENLMPNENDPGSQTPEPKYVSAEEVGNIVNAAVSSHMKRLNLETKISEAVKPLMEKLTSLAAPPANEEGSEPAKGKKATPEMAALTQQLEDMKRELKLRDEKVAAAEKQAREEKAYSELRSSLEGKVRPELADMLAQHLFKVENRVQFDETGKASFRVSRAPYEGAEPEDQLFPIAAGVQDFLKSSSAKAFLPAPSEGSGTPPLPRKQGAQPAPLNRAPVTDAEKIQKAAEYEARINAASRGSH